LDMERSIITERTELAGIPILHVRARTLQGPAPTILYFHGWSSKKEFNIIPAELLAIDGFRVIVPDQIHHGERGALADYPKAAKTHFWKVILHSIEEAAILRDAAVAAGWSQPEQFGVAGHSMGGFVSSGVLARFPWAQAAVLLNGCPCYVWADAHYRQTAGAFPAAPGQVERLSQFDPEHLVARVAPKPLLMQHGSADTSVPVGGVKRFYDLAKPHYAAHPERLALTIVDRLDHYVTNHMMEAMRNWFLQWVAPHA
jgi:uncharacterized protein